MYNLLDILHCLEECSALNRIWWEKWCKTPNETSGFRNCKIWFTDRCNHLLLLLLLWTTTSAYIYLDCDAPVCYTV